MQLDASFKAAWREAWKPVERLTISEWASRYITLPASYAIQGKMDFTRSKYMLAVLAALLDPKVRTILIQAGVQTGKSLLADIFIAFLIANAPSNILYLTADEDLAKTYANSRINPILKTCEPTRTILPVNRFGHTQKQIQFPNHTFLKIGGANEGNLQSLSVRYLIGDECWLWDEGYINQFLARSKAFPNTSKTLLISQAGEEGHDFTELWKQGHQAQWGLHCPACGQLQPWDFTKQRKDGSYAGINWDKVTEADGATTNIVETVKSVRYECDCGRKILDTPKTRRELNDGGDYIVQNPNADPSIKSFTWNSLANIDITFASVASEYLNAKAQWDRAGYFEPTKQFYLKTLARPWSIANTTQVTKAAIGEYDVSADWDKEVHRFMTVDVQTTVFYYVIRAWAANGESRLLEWKKVETWEQLREAQIKWKVKDQKVFIDCGFDETMVFTRCASFGHWGLASNEKFWFCWNALKGSGQPSFPHFDRKANKNVHKVFSMPMQGYANIGTTNKGAPCTLYHFASEPVSDILKRHLDGKASKYLIPTEDVEYTAQMNAETKRKFTDKYGKDSWRWVLIGKRDNHIWDAEKMQIVAASIAGALGGMA